MRSEQFSRAFLSVSPYKLRMTFNIYCDQKIQSVQFSCSVESDSLWPHGLQHGGLPVHHQLPELAQTHVHWVGDAIQPSHPLSSRLFLPSIFPSIRVFPNKSFLHIRWPKYWSFSISLSNEYSGLISFRIDWLDLLAVQGTLKSLLQHNSKASSLWHSAFFAVQLSHPYMTARKTITLTRWAFVGKVMSLLFNMLSIRFVIDFFPKEQASFNFMAAITICSDFGAQKNKVSHCFHCFPTYLPWSDGTGCHDLSFLNAEL